MIVSVDDPEPEIDAGEKLPEAPVGSPVTLNAIVPPKLPSAVAVAVVVVPPPGVIVCEEGEAETEKSPINSVTVADRVDVPSVPETVSEYVPVATAAVVVTVSVDEPVPEIDSGTKLPEAPLGKPETLNVTVPLKPPSAVEVAV